MTLTRMPSNRDKALRGLNARRVLRDLMAPNSEYPMRLATMLTSDTWKTHVKSRKDKNIPNEKENYTKKNCFSVSTYVNNEEVQPAPGIGEVFGKAICHPLQQHLKNEDVGEDFVGKLQHGFNVLLLLNVDIFKRLDVSNTTRSNLM